jgi:nucleoid-associated protein YgaU
MAVNQQQAAAALQKAGVNVYGLQVEDMGGSVTLRGTVGSEAEKQKAEQAVKQATDTEVANYLEVTPMGDSASGSAAGGQTYTVRSGDTLRKIAQRFYGDEMRWHAIRDANREQLPNPDNIQVGQQLNIPNA